MLNDPFFWTYAAMCFASGMIVGWGIKGDDGEN